MFCFVLFFGFFLGGVSAGSSVHSTVAILVKSGIVWVATGEESCTGGCTPGGENATNYYVTCYAAKRKRLQYTSAGHNDVRE
jgi:hypothetical protein